VQASKDRPGIIDAAFTKIHQRFESEAEELIPTTIVARRMPFDDQMNYKGEMLCSGCFQTARHLFLMPF
jgi:hypothetical protein